MLKPIMKAYLVNRDLDRFRESLRQFLRGDPSSESNKLYLKKKAGDFFYGQQYKTIIEAINNL